MKNLHLRKFFVFILMFAVLGFGCLMNYQPEVGAEETELTAEEERMQNGLTFSAKETYDTVKNLTTMPKTFEAYFNLPKTVNSRAGLLFGNYRSNTSLYCFTFEVHWANSKAYPKLYYDVDTPVGVSNPDPVNINFKSIDVRSDGYVHVVITHDPSTNTAKCYLNGELAEEITYTENEYYGDYEFVPTTTTGVGGDYRTGNTCAFLGSIKSLAFYTDVRTDAEVKEDYEAVINAEKDNSLLAPSDKADQTLLASYDLTQAGDAYLKDLSKNGYDLIHADDKGITYKGDTTVYE